MSDKFQPPTTKLKPLAELLTSGDVAVDDVIITKSRWQFNPPLQNFVNLLEAD